MRRILKIALSLWLMSHVHLSAESECCCCPSTDIKLSCPNYTFDVNFDALYLQPSGSHLSYVAIAYPLPLPSPHWKIGDIRPDYHFGFETGVQRDVRS